MVVKFTRVLQLLSIVAFLCAATGCRSGPIAQAPDPVVVIGDSAWALLQLEDGATLALVAMSYPSLDPGAAAVELMVPENVDDIRVVHRLMVDVTQLAGDELSRFENAGWKRCEVRVIDGELVLDGWEDLVFAGSYPDPDPYGFGAEQVLEQAPGDHLLVDIDSTKGPSLVSLDEEGVGSVTGESWGALSVPPGSIPVAVRAYLGRAPILVTTQVRLTVDTQFVDDVAHSVDIVDLTLDAEVVASVRLSEGRLLAGEWRRVDPGN